MNKLKYLLPLFLIFMFLGDAKSQTTGGYVIRARMKFNASSCGKCNDRSLREAFISNSPNRSLGTTYATYSFGSEDSWVQKFFKVNDTVDKLYFHYKNPVHNDWRYFEVPVNPTKLFEDNRKHNTGSITWWTTWIYAEVETIDPVKLISLAPQGMLTSQTYCIEKETENIVLKLSADNTTATRMLDLKGYVNGKEVISKYIGSYYSPTRLPTTVTLSFSNWELQQIFRENITFHIHSTHSTNHMLIIGSGYTASFYPKIPPTTVRFIRTACSEKVEITLPRGYGQKYTQYRFKISKYPEDQSHPYNLEFESINGDRIVFGVPIDIIDNSQYVIQVSSTFINRDNHQCARDIPLSSGTKPTQLNLKPTLNTYSFTDNEGEIHTYHITKKGANDGKAKITINEGNRISRFDWAINGGTWVTIPTANLTFESNNVRYLTGLRPNTSYNIRVLDNQGCFSQPITIANLAEPAEMEIKTKSSTLVSCHIKNSGEHEDGTLRIAWEGGIGPYTVKLVNSNNETLVDNRNVRAFDYQFENLKAGDYNIVVSDDHGSSFPDSHTVSSNPEIGMTVVTTDVKCHNGNTGTLEVSVSNSLNRNIKYDVTDQTASTTANYTKLYSGLRSKNYEVTVTVAGCSVTKNDNFVNQPSPISVDYTTTKIKKYGEATGEIDATIGGGIAPFTYDLRNSDGFEIKSGAYSGSIVAKNLFAGIYNLKAIDKNQCEKTFAISVIQPDSPLTITAIPQQAKCFNTPTGSVSISAAGGWGGYTFGIDGIETGTNSTIDTLTASTSTRQVFVKDSEGVFEYTEIIIGEPAELMATIKSIDHLRCFEDHSGAVHFNIDGGTMPYYVSPDNITWTEGMSIEGLAALNNQILYVKDENNCQKSVNAKITQPDKLLLSLDSKKFSTCSENNGMISVTAEGGTTSEAYTFSWYYIDSAKVVGNNSSVLSDIYSGKYKAIVTDANLCASSIEESISDINGPVIESLTVDSVSCYSKNDGRIHITKVSNGVPTYRYYINNKETTSITEELSAGKYHFRILDQNNCKHDRNITVYQPLPLTVHKESYISPTCHDYSDGSISLSVSGGNKGYRFTWDHTSETVPPVYQGEKAMITSVNIPGGSYGFTLSDIKNCQIHETLQLDAPLMPSPGWLETEAVICTGNKLVLDGGDFTSYKWEVENILFSTDRSVTLESGGNYSLEITDEKGCTGLANFLLNVSDHPLDAVFLMSDSALVNDIVSAIDVTWPIPDSIDWYYTKPVYTINENDWSTQFSWDKAENLMVTLRAWYGGCFSDTSKVLILYSGQENARLALAGDPLILGLTAYPNPSDGQFTVKAKFTRETEASLEIINYSKMELVHIEEIPGVLDFEKEYNFINNHQFKPGMYFIRLLAGKERQVIKIIVY